MKNRRLIFIGLACLSGVGGLAGLLYLRRKKEMIDYGHGQNVEPSKEAKELAKMIGAGFSPEKPNELSDREKKELQDRIKAMSHEELVAVVDAIPVSICLDRINNEIQKAAEIQESITRAYEMVKQ